MIKEVAAQAEGHWGISFSRSLPQADPAARLSQRVRIARAQAGKPRQETPNEFERRSLSIRASGWIGGFRGGGASSINRPDHGLGG